MSMEDGKPFIVEDSGEASARRQPISDSLIASTIENYSATQIIDVISENPVGWTDEFELTDDFKNMSEAERKAVQGVADLIGFAEDNSAKAQMIDAFANEVNEDATWYFEQGAESYSNALGAFIEGNTFLNIKGVTFQGEPLQAAENDPHADIRPIEVEIKAMLAGTSHVVVGLVSISDAEIFNAMQIEGYPDISSGAALEQISDLVKRSVIAKKIALYKMYTKMQNFLLIRLQKKSEEGAKVGITFLAIVLFLTLIVKKLEEEIDKFMRKEKGGIFRIGSATSGPTNPRINPENPNSVLVDKTFQFELNLSNPKKGDELKTLKKNIDTLTKLYRRRVDFINEADRKWNQSSASVLSRADFFKAIRNRQARFFTFG